MAQKLSVTLPLLQHIQIPLDYFLLASYKKSVNSQKCIHMQKSSAFLQAPKTH